MSLDNNAHNDSQNNAGNNNKGTNNMSQENSLFALLGQANLISSTSTITEVRDIVKSLEDTLEHLQKNTASPAQKMALPQLVQNITSDISGPLPGITLSTIIGGTRYVMPVLFYKQGVTEQTEVILLAGETMPRGIAKVASSFMTQELMEKVKQSSSFHEGKTLSKVIIVAPTVLNLEAFIKNAARLEDVAGDVRSYILKEWSTALFNYVILEVAKQGAQFPSPFKDGQVFGKDNAAVARIEPINKAIIDGKATPWNLAVKLATTNKNNTQNVNSNNTKSIATTYLNVSLECMNTQQFMQARQKFPGKVVGPLVPVISTGQTIPGETLNSNNSMIPVLLGLFASIGANNIQYFSEAIRGKEVGHRGNLSNFNNYMTQMLGQAYAQSVLTDKNITNAAVVNNWLNTYVAPNAVYVLDLATFTEDVSNSDFWWNILQQKSGSIYHKALITMLDVLTSNSFSAIIAENAAKGQNRNPATEWVMGDDILTPTPILMPTGIARAKDGKWFDLAEVDGMFLRQDQYYGNNEILTNEYMGLIGGQTQGDLKMRQYNIYTRLNQLFDTNVQIDGWKRRFIWKDAFFHTLARAMANAGTLTMSSSNMASMWTMQHSNDYLNYTMTAAIQQGMQTAGMGGFTGAYSNHY
ncbi:hypothetical protein D5W64_13255 [Salmonella enterica subsp. enterica serovar Saintpaul]|nr:hypothetical protein [Salmonella enterica subsp. enterica serovar Saintpaul]